MSEQPEIPDWSTATSDEILDAVSETLAAYRTRYVEAMADFGKPRDLLITRWQLRLLEQTYGTTDRDELDRLCTETLAAVSGWGPVHLVLFDDRPPTDADRFAADAMLARFRATGRMR